MGKSYLDKLNTAPRQQALSDQKSTPPIWIRNPTIGEAASAIRRALSAQRLLILVGNCRVEYKGRASSVLGWGERVVIVKCDGSVLVHRPTGYEPVNWQPSRCIFRVEAAADRLLIVASRSQKNEVLSLLFDRIMSLESYELSDVAAFDLYVSEEQMKQAILARPSLVENGFHPIGSETNLGEAGFTDIVGEDSKGNLVVVEIKRNAAGRDSVLQLSRYIDSIKKNIGRGLRGIIVAPELRRGAQTLLASMKLEFKAISPQECSEVLAERETRKISEFLQEKQ